MAINRISEMANGEKLHLPSLAAALFKGSAAGCAHARPRRQGNIAKARKNVLI